MAAAAVIMLCFGMDARAGAAASATNVRSVTQLREGDFGDANELILEGYFGPSPAGGGPVHRDVNDNNSADNGCTIFVDSRAHRFKRPPGPVFVSDCGARGDGSADDTLAEQNAIAVAKAGGQVVWPHTEGCYVTTSTLVVAKPLTLSGGGRICLQTPNISLFLVGASDVTLDALTLVGPQFATYHGGENAITATGKFRSGMLPLNIKDFTAKNLDISNFGAAGIQANYMDGFLIEGNTIHNLPYAGIMALSTIHGRIHDNSVANITGVGSAGSNAYGISVSRYSDDPGELTSQPRPADITIDDNSISGVPAWEGLDTHSGRQIEFLNNKVRDTHYGIAVGPSRDSHRRYSFAPLDVTVSGNTVDSGVTDGSRGTGISLNGAPDVENASGAISRNRIIGYGDASTTADGAVRAYSTTALAITGNTIIRPSPNGIVLDNDNTDTVISDNSIGDPFTNARMVGGVQGIFINGVHNNPRIARNSIMHEDKSASYLLTSPGSGAIRISPGPGNTAVIGTNPTNAPRFLINLGAMPVTRPDAE